MKNLFFPFQKLKKFDKKDLFSIFLHSKGCGAFFDYWKGAAVSVHRGNALNVKEKYLENIKK